MNLTGGSSESNSLLRLWFYTIRGFDVLEPEMNVEESRAYLEQYFKEAEDLRSIRYDKKPVMVLVRNEKPVEADLLTANPRWKTPEHEKARDYDYWYPHYKWDMSDYTNSLIKDKQMTLTD